MPKVSLIFIFLLFGSGVRGSPIEREEGKGLLQQCVDICRNLSKGNTVWMPFYCFLIFPNLPMSCSSRSTSKANVGMEPPIPCPDDSVECNRTLSIHEVIGEVNTDDGRYQLIKEHLINNRVYIVMKRVKNQTDDESYEDGDLLLHTFDSIQTLPEVPTLDASEDDDYNLTPTTTETSPSPSAYENYPENFPETEQMINVTIQYDVA